MMAHVFWTQLVFLAIVGALVGAYVWVAYREGQDT